MEFTQSVYKRCPRRYTRQASHVKGYAYAVVGPEYRYDTHVMFQSSIRFLNQQYVATMVQRKPRKYADIANGKVFFQNGK